LFPTFFEKLSRKILYVFFYEKSTEKIYENYVKYERIYVNI